MLLPASGRSSSIDQAWSRSGIGRSICGRLPGRPRFSGGGAGRRPVQPAGAVVRAAEARELRRTALVAQGRLPNRHEDDGLCAHQVHSSCICYWKMQPFFVSFIASLENELFTFAMLSLLR